MCHAHLFQNINDTNQHSPVLRSVSDLCAFQVCFISTFAVHIIYVITITQPWQTCNVVQVYLTLHNTKSPAAQERSACEVITSSYIQGIHAVCHPSSVSISTTCTTTGLHWQLEPSSLMCSSEHIFNNAPSFTNDLMSHIQGLPKKCTHTLTKENSMFYNGLL